MTEAGIATPNDLSERVDRSPARGERMMTLDAARFVAAIAIVWLHTPDSRALRPLVPLSGFAVPFFVLSSVLLVFQGVRRDPARPFSGYLVSRFKRVYVPFLLWTVVYLVVRNLKHMLVVHDPLVLPHAAMLYTGSAHHLWFLPFILVLTTVAFAIAKLVARIESARVAWSAFAVLTIAGLVAGLDPPDRFARWYLMDRAWAAAPAILWAFAIALVHPRLPESIFHSRALTVAAGVAWAGFAALTVAFGDRLLLLENLSGLAFFVVGLALWPAAGRGLSWLASLGPLAYGIFLSHVMFVEGFQAVAARLGLTSAAWLDVVIFATTCVMSVWLVSLLSRARWGRWFVP